ncbi:MAG: hypothetical protein ACE149_10530 [Armatimonadota bacterium]
MGKQVRLFHSVQRSRLEEVLRTGIRAASHFDDLGLEMRRGVVFCWLRKEDDKMSSGGQRPDHTYVEVAVEEERCVVADMDLFSIALMYCQGSGGKPRNPEASRLLAEAYRVSAVPLAAYGDGIFFTPEVLVRGDIGPESIRPL